MKVSLNWLKDFINIDDSTENLAEKLTFGGLEIEGIEKYESLPGGLKGIVIGEVLSCEKHPNADRLSITSVDIGAEKPSPIVCGAPNVAAGQKVLVATVGATIHPTGGEAFKIKKAKIRGEVSEGMICAEDELGLGEDHDGIMVLKTDLPNGTAASEYFENYIDEVLEIGLTPNRGDATGHLGVARDIKALYRSNLKSYYPENFPEKGEILPIEVELLNPEACPRYAGILISGLEIKESPAWLQNRLKAIGQKPINNVVDVTNFILHDLGQPLHAFDYDKIKGSKVIVKYGLKGEKFITLDEVERKLHQEDLMICNEEAAMCIGGVFGGKDSGVSENTKAIFLESACFDPVFIRKTSQRHGLKTDAAFRFERGTDIEIVVPALKKAAALLNDLAGGKISSELIDIYPEKKKAKKVEVRKSDIQRLIGVEIEHKRIIEILSDLDIELIEENEKAWTFKVPFYRTEVYRSADLIEEILRIFGFNSIPLEKESGSTFLAPSEKNDPYIQENAITELLIGKNFNEIQTNSLTKKEYSLLSEHFDGKNENAEILNKLSEDLGIMRDNLLYSSLEVLRHNINRKQQNLRLFEFGFIYAKNKNGFSEKRMLQLSLAGQANEESWMSENKPQNFFDLKSSINSIFDRLGLERPDIEISDKEFLNGGGFILKADNNLVGWLGSVNSKILDRFDINSKVWSACLDMEKIASIRKKEVLFEEIPKFPEVRRDLSLVLDESVNYDQILEIAENVGGDLIQSVRVFDVFKGKPLENGQKSYALSFILIDKSQTLKDERIDQLMNKLISKYEKETGAIIRR